MPSMKLFVCTNPNCAERDGPRKGDSFAFSSTEMKPACPRCKVSMADPRFGKTIQRLVAIHFDPPAPVPGYGMGHRACDPDVSIQVKGGPDGADADFLPNPYHMGTGDPDAVTCPACRATAAWEQAMAEKHSESVAALRGSLQRIRQFVVAG